MLPHDEAARLHDKAVLAGVEAQAAGRFGLALEFFHESLEHATSLERLHVHSALINISSCYLSQGDWSAARVGLASIILESDQPAIVSAASAQLAEALMREGRLEKAGHYLRIALENALAAGDDSRALSARVMQGHLAVMEARYEDSVAHYEAAVELRRRVGSDSYVTESALHERLGYAQVLAGRTMDGLRSLRRSLRGARRSGSAYEQAETHADLAFAFLLASKNTASERHALRALALASAHSFPTIIKNATYILMELALRRDQETEFERWFEKLQDLLPDVRLSRDFFRIFDISDVISLKDF